MNGVLGAGLDEQRSFLRECCPEDVRVHLGNEDIYRHACELQGAQGYGPIEAEFLYAYVYSKRPGQIFQIGCGVSTAICLQAANDAGYAPDIICVEPYPSLYLERLAAENRIRLLRTPAQELPLREIESLDEDVFFFVDSSHTLGPAGEVGRIILEMLPRLKPGATVHFHDIYFPYDFEPGVLDDALFFWHESALLHAYLTGNSKVRILVSLSMIHDASPGDLREIFPRYRPALHESGVRTEPGHFPASTYLRVVS